MLVYLNILWKFNVFLMLDYIFFLFPFIIIEMQQICDGYNPRVRMGKDGVI